MLTIDLSRYRVPPEGSFSLASIAPDDTQALRDKDGAKKQLKRNRDRLRALQERLFAENEQSLLVVLQAMDTGGKDSTIRRVTRGINPQGCRVEGFKAPSTRERAHDFLWRIHQRVPQKGGITIFNRSHYEDVLVVRVDGLAGEELIERRYGHINDFERLLADHGTRTIKIMLHISRSYQREQLIERVEEADKHWKFDPGDLRKRAQWDAYMEAYELALNRCSTSVAPWYVIPAERRWFRDLAVSQLLVETLEEMNPRFPEPDYDVTAFTRKSIV